MSFLYPNFLFGLFAIAIPIVVHLFNFHRYKKVYFTNVSVLRDIEIRTRKQNNLYKWLLLLFRCLIVIFVVLMFAQPYLKDEQKALVQEGENVVVVFVDNSFSMQNASDKGIMLDKAKLKAKEIVESYSSADKFCLLTMDLAGKERHFMNREMFLQSLSEVEITPTSKMFSEIYNTAHKLLNQTNNNSKRCFFVSDFQKVFIDESNFKQDSIENIFVPLEVKNQSNVFIDSLWIESKSIMPQSDLELKVSIKNSSEDDVEKLPLKLIVDGEQVAISSVDLLANERKVVNLNFTISRSGVLHSKLAIEDSPVLFDNDFYFTLNVRDKVKVLSLNQSTENAYLKRLFNTDEQVSLHNESVANPNYSSFGTYSMIILNGLNEIGEGLSEELKKFVENSGSLMIVPSKDMNLESINAFLSRLSLPVYSSLQNKDMRVSEFDAENYLFKDVFTNVSDKIALPTVSKYFPIESFSSTAKQSVMTYSNGKDFLAISPKNMSDVYMLSVGLDEEFGDFVNNSLFVPLMWNMCVLSQIKTDLYYTIGERDLVKLPIDKAFDNGDLFVVQSVKDSMDFIPNITKNQSNISLNPYNQIKNAGNYNLVKKGEVFAGFSMNYSSRESLLEFYDDNELSKLLDKYSNTRVFDTRKLTESQFKSSDVGFSFTFLLVLLALLSIVCEVVLLYKLNKLK